jgi:Na+/melibiose symporter-like transporter
MGVVIKSMVAPYPSTDPQPFFFGLAFALVGCCIYLFFALRQVRKIKAEKNAHGGGESISDEMAKMKSQLPKFWKRSRTLTILGGFALIVSAPLYFWSVPDTPSADFAAGLGLLLFGVVLNVICLVSFALEEQEAMRRLGIKRPKKRF